ncbi:hypothetical protein GCM10020254_72260 [Streptomyces goshikiensis]
MAQRARARKAFGNIRRGVASGMCLRPSGGSSDRTNESGQPFRERSRPPIVRRSPSALAPSGPAGGRPAGDHTTSGTGWISLAGWPVRSWIRMTASAEGASDRQ